MHFTSVNIIMDLFALAVLTIIWFADLKANVEMTNKPVFRAMEIAISTCLGADAVSYMLYGCKSLSLWYFALFANTVYYLAQIIFCWLWFLYAYSKLMGKSVERPGKKEFFFAIPMLVEYVIIAFVNPFYSIIFSIDESCTYHRGPYYELNLITHYLYIVVAFVLATISVIRDKKYKDDKRYNSLLLLSAMPILASLVQSFSDPSMSLIWPITAFSVYILYQLEAQKYIETTRLATVELEAQLSRQKINVMMSQIQPHFLYNTLTTIRALCGTNPSQAQEVITTFSNYLRTNMDSINLPTPVPFSKELEHTKAYISIEKLRFPDLTVDFDIQDSVFLIPALSIQPMVENAIKHGIRPRLEPGGKIIIHSFFDGENHVVEISDNGVGFSGDEPIDKSRSHIGVMNTRKRIEDMVGGFFEIASTPGEGTKVTFVIPSCPSMLNNN